ncbi:MAG: hypothetical protein DHS20C16_12790 [Phycisphaerae bacterium]|nr:MAG: hypothetical protein DHS20C16_12790 [Phycisphaerae bacterium]
MMTQLKVSMIPILVAASLVSADAADPEQSTTETVKPIPIRLAVFDVQVDKKLPVTSEAATDRVLALCGIQTNVTLVDRAELSRVASEQKMSLSGLTDAGEGVKLGGFVAASHILVGRLSTIGQSNYLILKLVDVETTEQKVISLRSHASDSPDKLFDPLEKKLADALNIMPTKETPDDGADLKQFAAWLQGSTVLVDISEKHINRPLPDPSSAVVAFNMLGKLGINVVMPNSPPAGWKDALLSSGQFQEAKVDYLLEGEGLSSFATELRGLTSCRARVELRLVPVPGRNVMITEAGIGAEVDLAEALAAKAALEEATREAVTKMIKTGNTKIAP